MSDDPASNNWQAVLQTLQQHADYVQDIRGSNRPHDGFDLGAIKQACSKVEKLQDMTPAEAPDLLEQLLGQIPPPAALDQDDHQFRSQVHDIWVVRDCLEKLKSEAAPDKTEPAPLSISKTEYAVDLNTLTQEVIKLRQSIQSNVMANPADTPIFEDNPSDWLARKRALIKDVTGGASVTLAGPGINLKGLSALLELLQMHLQPMVEINTKILDWYARGIADEARTLAQQAKSESERVLKRLIETSAAASTKIVESIVGLIQKVTGCKDEKKSEAPFESKDQIESDERFSASADSDFPTNRQVEEAMCIELCGDNIRISSTHDGLLYDEPSLAVLNEAQTLQSGALKSRVRIGVSGLLFLKQNPGVEVNVERFTQRGHIENAIETGRYIRRIFENRLKKPQWHERVLVAVKSDTTKHEKTDLAFGLKEAGAKHVAVIEQAIPSALGAGLNVHSPTPVMNIIAGHQTIEVNLLSNQKTLSKHLIPFGGWDFDRSFSAHLTHEFETVFAEADLLTLREQIGAVLPRAAVLTTMMEVPTTIGRTETRAAISISSDLFREATEGAFQFVLSECEEALLSIPPRTRTQIESSGICLSGSLARLPGLATALQDHLQVRIFVAAKPSLSTIIGLHAMTHAVMESDAPQTINVNSLEKSIGELYLGT